MNWCVYLLLCANGALYAGISNRPQARLAAHLAGKGAKYTRSHSAQEMRIVACCLDRSAASKLERVLKRMTAAQKRTNPFSGCPKPLQNLKGSLKRNLLELKRCWSCFG